MNRSRTTTLLSITLGAILFTGAIMPILSQQAFAQVDSQDNLTNPPWGANAQDSVLADLTDDNFASDANPSCVTTQAAGTFVLQNFNVGPTQFNLHATVPGVTVGANGATVDIPNLIDPLLTKNFLIQHTYCEIGTGPTSPAPVVLGISCKDPTGNTAGSRDTTSGVLTGEPGQTPASIYIKEEWNCQPNPDWEVITLQYDPTRFALIQVVVDTISTGDPDPPVGGTFEGVNTAALLVAGAQANALWLIPLITAIGIGIVVVNRKRF